MCLALAVVAAGCGVERAGTEPPEPPEPPEPLEAPSGAASPPAQAPDPVREAEPEPASPGCPSGMALVEGGYCPAVEHRCLAWQEVNVTGTPEKNQCRLYATPARCLRDTRQPMRFCMDRYEWPNRRGEIPRVLVSWLSARELCASQGKRLCTEEEFTFACEGEEMRPHVYGFERDATRCSIDRPYRPRTFTFLPLDACLADPACKEALDAIDQRLPAGSMPGCRSEAGVFDLNGNVNEWVMLPNEKGPKRSGIKGGWWGPVRNRCRPTVTFHDEGDFGYEVGFRCCADAGAAVRTP